MNLSKFKYSTDDALFLNWIFCAFGDMEIRFLSFNMEEDKLCFIGIIYRKQSLCHEHPDHYYVLNLFTLQSLLYSCCYFFLAVASCAAFLALTISTSSYKNTKMADNKRLLKIFLSLVISTKLFWGSYKRGRLQLLPSSAEIY